MADIKWIKICTDIFDDEKILLIESMPEKDSLIVIWFKLLCMAGKQNNDGVFVINDKIAYTDEMLATIFRRPLNTVRLALKVFEQYGMIEIANGAITIPNWDKHQSIDELEKIKIQTRNRVSKYREKQKIIAGNVTSNATCNVTPNVTVTLCNATDKIRLDKNRVDKNRKDIEVSCETTPTRHKYGEYSNVLLSDSDMDKLTSEFPNDYKDRIERLSAYMASTGKSYKNHLATIRNWSKRDRQNATKKSTSFADIAKEMEEQNDELF